MLVQLVARQTVFRYVSRQFLSIRDFFATRSEDAEGENMSITRSVLVALGAMLSMVGCATTTSQQLANNHTAGRRCEALTDLDQRVQKLLSSNSIDRVEPAFHEVPHFAGPSPLYVEGAAIYILADTDINDAYIERALSCYAAASSGPSLIEHPLRVEGIRSVSARAAGPTIRVSILGIDRASGEEIWKRTQALHETGGRVEVRQLSSAPATSSPL
jgi:hypothetical protein